MHLSQKFKTLLLMRKIMSFLHPVIFLIMLTEFWWGNQIEGLTLSWVAVQH
jgi:hypothetical protein